LGELALKKTADKAISKPAGKPEEKPEKERITSGKLSGEDTRLDINLRPKRLADFIGQDKVKDNLGIAMAAANGRGEQLDHVLLYGPPGLGKTTQIGRASCRERV